MTTTAKGQSILVSGFDNGHPDRYKVEKIGNTLISTDGGAGALQHGCCRPGSHVPPYVGRRW